MLFNSPLQLLVLCAVAVVAWLLGFATNPAGTARGEAMRKLTRDFATFRSQSQSRLNTLARHAATLEATHETMVERLAGAEARIAAFRDASLRHDARSPAPAPEAIDSDSADPIIPPLTPGETAAPPPETEAFADLVPTTDAVMPPLRDVVPRDVLTRIDGIDQALALRLVELGLSRFEDIAKLSDQDEMALELRLALPAGYITSRQWRQQAATLLASDLADLATRFGPSRGSDL